MRFPTQSEIDAADARRASETAAPHRWAGTGPPSEALLNWALHGLGVGWDRGIKRAGSDVAGADYLADVAAIISRYWRSRPRAHEAAMRELILGGGPSPLGYPHYLAHPSWAILEVEAPLLRRWWFVHGIPRPNPRRKKL